MQAIPQATRHSNESMHVNSVLCNIKLQLSKSLYTDRPLPLLLLPHFLFAKDSHYFKHQTKNNEVQYKYFCASKN